MAVLSDENRTKIWRGLMRYWSDQRDGIAFSKAELRTMVDDLDVFLDNNAGAINSAITNPPRSTATAAQKAFVLAVVALARHDPAEARRLINTD